MTEEKNGASKNKWSRIFKKKWFFPAVYLTVAAILLTVVVWYQNVDRQVPDANENQGAIENENPDLYDEDAEAVMEQQETIKMPVNDQEKAEIVTKFYDSTSDEEDKEDALVFHNNRYYQSTGIDITLGDEESFDVLASLSGEVEEIKEDPVLGNVVTLSHENDAMTFYASMDNIEAEAGDEVKQGDTLGTAGNNVFGKDIGPHVHFELRKEDEPLNPEDFFNQALSELDKVEVEEDETDEDEADEGEEEPDADQNNDENDEDNEDNMDNEDSEKMPGDMNDEDEDEDQDEDSNSNDDNENEDNMGEDNSELGDNDSELRNNDSELRNNDSEVEDNKINE